MNGSRDRRRPRQPKVEPQLAMTFREAIEHVRAGGQARRPHWHQHSFIYAEKGTERELWCDHRPYFPDLKHRRVSPYLSCDGDRTTNDWLKYEVPDGATPAGR